MSPIRDPARERALALLRDPKVIHLGQTLGPIRIEFRRPDPPLDDPGDDLVRPVHVPLLPGEDTEDDPELRGLGYGGEAIVYHPRVNRIRLLHLNGTGPMAWLDRFLAACQEARRG